MVEHDAWSGIDKEIVESTASFFGVNYTIQHWATPDRVPNDTNATWTSLMVQALPHCDWILTNWKKTSERIAMGARFADTLGSDNTIIISSKYRTDDGVGELSTDSETGVQFFLNSGAVIFSPFDVELWLAILAAMVMSALALYLVEYDMPDFADTETFLGGLGTSMWLSFGMFTGAGNHAPSTAAGRVLLSSYSLLVVFIISWYTADLASTLLESRAAAQQYTDLTSISQLASTGVSMTLCLPSPQFRTTNYYFHSLLDPSAVPLPANLRTHVAEECDILTTPDACRYLIEGPTRLCDAMATAANQYRRASSQDPSFACELYQVGGNVREVQFSHIIGDDFQARCGDQMVNYHLLRLHDSGEFPRMIERYMPSASCNPTSTFTRRLAEAGGGISGDNRMAGRHLNAGGGGTGGGVGSGAIRLLDLSFAFIIFALSLAGVFLQGFIKRMPQFFPACMHPKLGEDHPYRLKNLKAAHTAIKNLAEVTGNTVKRRVKSVSSRAEISGAFRIAFGRRAPAAHSCTDVVKAAYPGTTQKAPAPAGASGVAGGGESDLLAVSDLHTKLGNQLRADIRQDMRQWLRAMYGVANGSAEMSQLLPEDFCGFRSSPLSVMSRSEDSSETSDMISQAEHEAIVKTI